MSLSAVLRVLNPVEATDTRGNPAVPAPKMLQNIAKSVLRGIQAGQSRAFPGAMPVGLARRNMKDVRTNYFVAEKSDGERRLLVAVHDKAAGRVRCCLVDRKGTVEVARVTGGKPLKPGTVLDGEIVRNLAHQAPVFLIFDVLHNGQEDVSQATFSATLFRGPLVQNAQGLPQYEVPTTYSNEGGRHARRRQLPGGRAPAGGPK